MILPSRKSAPYEFEYVGCEKSVLDGPPMQTSPKISLTGAAQRTELRCAEFKSSRLARSPESCRFETIRRFTGYVTCSECGERASVHQQTRGSGRLLYSRGSCKFRNSPGRAFQLPPVARHGVASRASRAALRHARCLAADHEFQKCRCRIRGCRRQGPPEPRWLVPTGLALVVSAALALLFRRG